MSTFDIKIIAIVLMVIDHIGLFFFPHYILFRAIGRLAFPLFAWLIANGAYHTHNIKKYAIRLFLFAVISQIPFQLANVYHNPSFKGLNVLFTLFIGLAAIMLIKKTRSKYLWSLIVILAAAIAQFLQTDYGYIGVLTIISFYLFFKNKKRLILSQVSIFLLLPGILILFQRLTHVPLASFIESGIESFALFALLFIFNYNGQPGPKTKYLFYIFYPIQYLLIFFLMRIMK